MISEEYKSASQQGHSAAMSYVRNFEKELRTDVLDKIIADIQKLRNCSCICSDGIIDDVEDIIDKYRKRGKSMKLTEFMDERYNNRKDKDNIFGVGVSDAEFRAFIIDYLLGEDWYVADPLGQIQINEVALYEILKKYSKRYKKECRNRK